MLAPNPREVIGGNNPPQTAIELARGCYTDMAKFLTENPVILTEESAREGAKIITRGKSMVAEIESERRKQTDPLNEQVKTINATYKKPRELIEGLTGETSRRVTEYARAEEQRRAREAEEKRLAAEEAERIAREAEAKEAEVKENASLGEVVNVASAIAEADHAFDQYQSADRAAARAERDVPVRLGTGIGRVVSMRTKETLTVDDPAAALAALGLTESIREAILTSARAYRKLNGNLPAGVTSHAERSI